MLAKPVIPVLIFSPSLSIIFFSFNNQFKLSKSDSLVACLSILGMASNGDCTGQKDAGGEERTGREKGRLDSVPVSSLHGI